MQFIESKSSILIVDDLPENLLSLEALLGADKYNLIKANSGEEALEVLFSKGDRIALALLDVQMPGMNGFELAELMRGTEKTKNIPIIFLTAGLVGDQKKFTGYEAGAVDFIQKPIEADILRSKVNIFSELFQKNIKIAAHRDALAKSKADVQRLLEESQNLTRELKKQDKNKDEFLATLAHEIRNPLAPLMNSLEILNKNPDIENKQDLHGVMLRQVKHLTNLVNDLMDLSRVNKGKIDLNRAEIELSDVLELALDLSMPLIETKKHSFTQNLPTSVVKVNADQSRLAQIIGNLLQNAAKYTPDNGEINLTVTADADNLKIIVQDNGVGIPAEKQAQIYDIFKQLQRNTDSSEAGLGIGLSLVRRLTELHGGTIQVVSEGHNQGSTFTVTLPIVTQLSGESDTALQELASAPSTDTLKVLIIDDNKELAETLSMMVELLDCDYVLAHNGEDAIRIAQEERPHIILCDIGLPDITGHEVAQKLTQVPALSHTLFVAQTGWGQESDIQRTKDAGFHKHLVKPVSFGDLEEVVEGYSI
ncbi:MAG: response regulator [Pseudomonadota bacterium]|nr:response regulator [Pseudomonadota bacterium]